MKGNDWRGQLQEIIEEETDMERPMIPRYAKGYAKLVLEDFISRELDKAREGQFTQQELKRIEELLGFMLSDYPSSFWKPEDKSIEKKLSKLKDNK